MKISDLMEKVSSEVYHFSTINGAYHIMRDETFKLTSSVGDEKEELLKKNNLNFYLSVTRSKSGSYHSEFDEGVLFVLDGDKLNSKYKGAPVDYYADNSTNRRQEAEDRVFSKTNTIPIHGVVKSAFIKLSKFNNSTDIRAKVKTIINALDEFGIVWFAFFDMDSWKLQQKAKALSKREILDFINGGKFDKLSKVPLSPSEENDEFVLSIWSSFLTQTKEQMKPSIRKHLTRNVVTKPHTLSKLKDALVKNRKPGSLFYNLVSSIVSSMSKNNIKTIGELPEFAINKFNL